MEAHTGVKKHSRLWTTLSIEETQRNYGDRLRDFVYALLFSVSSSCPTTYQFPLTELEMSTIQAFRKLLLKKMPADTGLHASFLEEQVAQFHTLVALFLLSRAASNPAPTPSVGKFDSVLECLCAVTSVRENGSLQSPHLSTNLFAQLKYLTRGTLLYEGNKRVKDFESLAE